MAMSHPKIIKHKKLIACIFAQYTLTKCRMSCKAWRLTKRPWICEKSAISWMDIVKGIGVKSGTGHRHSIWEDNNIGNG